MIDTAKELLRFSAVSGVAGTENHAARHAEELLAPFGKISYGKLGSIVCTVKEPKENGVHVLLDAHMDEIGMIVTFITDDGFLRVANCGGIDRRLLMASQVKIHTQYGDISGLVCSIPPHLQRGGGEKRNLKTEEIYIDTGMSKQKCEEKIKPGDRVTLCSQQRTLLNGLVSGKALDDRAGCISLVKALEYLGNTAELDCGLSVMFSTMEEVGGMGALTSAFEVNPTHAIAVDVSYAHTPDASREKCGILSDGPMIGVAPILSKNMSDVIIKLAQREEIPFQIEVMSGKTGTNADEIATVRRGVKTALISIPQKYMHTPVEVVDPIDVENTGKLLAVAVKCIAKGEI